MSVPRSTLDLIRQWAAWGAMQNLGYPKKVPFFGQRTDRTPLYASDYIPPDIHRMEKAACRIEPQERRLIIHRHLWHMSLSEIAQQHGFSKSTAWRQVEQAEYAIHVEFERI